MYFDRWIPRNISYIFLSKENVHTTYVLTLRNKSLHTTDKTRYGPRTLLYSISELGCTNANKTDTCSLSEQNIKVVSA